MSSQPLKKTYCPGCWITSSRVIVVLYLAEQLVYELETFHHFIDWDNEDNEPPDTVTFDEVTINALTDEITTIIGEE